MDAVKRDEEKALTSLRHDTSKSQKLCFMAIEPSTTHLVGEGKSIMRPPLFVGDNYAYWKTIIRLFIQATGYEAWMMIVNGTTIFKKKVGDEEVIKKESE